MPGMLKALECSTNSLARLYKSEGEAIVHSVFWLKLKPPQPYRPGGMGLIDKNSSATPVMPIGPPVMSCRRAELATTRRISAAEIVAIAR